MKLPKELTTVTKTSKILAFVVFITLPFLGFFLGMNYQSSLDSASQAPTTKPILSKRITPSQINESSNYKNIKIANLTLKYPASWKGLLSEIPYTPGELENNKIYNIIEVHEYPNQMYIGYSNREWFDRIYKLKINESYSDQRDKRTKLMSGNVISGENYVIFKNEPSSTFSGSPAYQVVAYIIKSQALYQLTLNFYNDYGLETFKHIVAFAVVN